MLKRVLSLTMLVLVGLANSSFAEQGIGVARFVEGEHYELIEPSVAVRDADKVEVVEMFSYACIHCYNFDTYVQAWKSKQADDVDFRAVPAIFNPDWEALAVAFYTAEALGVSDEVHERMFRASISNRKIYARWTSLHPYS